jgi:RNA polymerase sigma-70 factor (ECF subfamily)
LPDLASFDGFYVATRQRMVAYAYALTGDATEAQDAAQEAYARAWAHWRTVRTLDNPEAWVRKVVWRIAANRWRHLAAAARAAIRLSPPAARVEATDDHVSLVAALQSIPESQRRAIVLRYVYDLTVDQVAEECAVPVGTVKSRLSRGMHALSGFFSDPAMAEYDGASRQLDGPGELDRGARGDHA